MERSEYLRIEANTLDVMASAASPVDAEKSTPQTEQAKRIETAQQAAESPAPDSDDDEGHVPRDYGKLFAHYGTNKQNWQNIDRAVAVRHARRLIRRGFSISQVKGQLKTVLQKYSPTVVAMPDVKQYLSRTINQSLNTPEVKQERQQEQAQRNTRSILADTSHSQNQGGEVRKDTPTVDPRTKRDQETYSRLYQQTAQEFQQRGKEMTPEKTDHIIAWKLYTQEYDANEVRNVLRQSPHAKSAEQGETYVTRTMANAKREVELVRQRKQHEEMIRLQRMRQSHGMEM